MAGLAVDDTGFEVLAGDERIGSRRAIGPADVEFLADRIRKRRRAAELIDHAHQLAAHQVTIYLMSQSHAVELSTLTPDQLLDMADEDQAG